MTTPIETHYTRVATISRMTDIGDGKQSLQNVFEDIPCHVQPLDDSFGETFEGSFGKDFLMFTYSRDIQQGDRATIDGEEYKVMSIERYKFLKRVRHMECRIRMFKNN